MVRICLRNVTFFSLGFSSGCKVPELGLGAVWIVRPYWRALFLRATLNVKCLTCCVVDKDVDIHSFSYGSVGNVGVKVAD